MHEQVSRIAILGFGREGQSLLRFIKKNPDYRGREIWILDKDTSVKNRLEARQLKNVHWQVGSGYLKNLSRFDLILRSPGIPYTLPQLYRARCDGTKVSSATNLFFHEIRKLPGNQRPAIIGVTGTKGKGTTSTLIYQMLRSANRRTILAGNIGKPMLEILPEAKRTDFVVLELSSFQLQDFPYAPDIAVVLDIFPDHLDQHKTLREYYGSKANIGRFQKKSDAIFFFSNNPLSKKIAAKSPARKFPVKPKTESLRKNYEMATSVAKFLNIPESTLEKIVKSFRGLEHRMEKVRTKGNITFWNDSAATNPEATAAAIRTIKSPLVLIAGGKDKNLNYRPLADAILESLHVKSVILIGENRKKIEKELKADNKKLSIVLASDLEEAVNVARRTAESLVISNKSSVAVLFSPGAASFDMFKSYADRGEQFKKIVRKL
ncbi:MAG: UDP-N-acetylmuramoyl-L-alanine--D-glutamate ligase [Patescibacteria group bacterium]